MIQVNLNRPGEHLFRKHILFFSSGCRHQMMDLHLLHRVLPRLLHPPLWSRLPQGEVLMPPHPQAAEPSLLEQLHEVGCSSWLDKKQKSRTIARL